MAEGHTSPGHSGALTATDAVFAPTSLLLVGLACLALHLAGIGTGWTVSRRRR